MSQEQLNFRLVLEEVEIRNDDVSKFSILYFICYNNNLLVISNNINEIYYKYVTQKQNVHSQQWGFSLPGLCPPLKWA